MGKSTAFSTSLLGLVFQGAAIAGLADNAAAGALANLYVSLHKADPGVGGNQQSSEASYAGYARAAVARSNVGFTVTGNVVEPAANVVFPAPTGGPSETELFFAIGTVSAGAGEILYSGPLTAPINTATGIAPILGAAATSVEET